MSIWVTLEMQIKKERHDALLRFLEENVPNVRNFDGAESVTLLLQNETGTLLIVEEWKSKEHHQNYISFITQNGVMEQLVSFMQAPPEVNYYDELPG